jgi:UDP-N-acetylmuramoyl-tripeptide--D-alanyl-D-alanine ligase
MSTPVTRRRGGFAERFARRKWLAAAALLGVLGAGGMALWAFGDRALVRLVTESPSKGRCNIELTRSAIDRSIELGARFLLAHQKPAGNFDYEYDWRAKRYTDEDNEVRQAGALWGVALLYRDQPTPERRAAVEKGLSFFETHSVNTEHGTRCVAYPGRSSSGIGTVALVALSIIEYLRTPGAPPNARAHQEAQLNGYLAELRAAVNPDGLWFGDYSTETCTPSGQPSPYSDGEALLTLVEAMKYLGRDELRELALRAAEAGHELNVTRALAEDSDSDRTKGYYQWSSMAYYELATSDVPHAARFGDYLLSLADWQIDVHHTLLRRRNTGYAYEGLIPAYDMARRRGDRAREAKYACVIDIGLQRLMSWQVGGPLANRSTRDVDPNDRLAVGGVQNAAHDPPLRIDVTQHQTHALLFARQFIYSR